MAENTGLSHKSYTLSLSNGRREDDVNTNEYGQYDYGSTNLDFMTRFYIFGNKGLIEFTIK